MFKAPQFFTAIAAIATLSVAGIAIPAHAAETDDKPVSLKKQERNGVTVYCAKYASTGSRVPRNVCLTKSEWNARGAAINDASDDVAAANKTSADRS